MEIVIEKPKVIHAKCIAHLCSTGWKQTVEGILSEEYQKKNVEFWYNLKRVEKDIKAGVYSYIALNHSEVVGVIGGGKTGPEKGEVFVFYIDENVRYKGIGTKLLEALTEEQLREGISEQWVSVQEGNERGTPFYEARGFTFQGKQVNETKTGEQQVSLRYSRVIVK